MNIRDADKADAQMCGRILHDAFKNLAERHCCATIRMARRDNQDGKFLIGRFPRLLAWI